MILSELIERLGRLSDSGYAESDVKAINICEMFENEADPYVNVVFAGSDFKRGDLRQKEETK